MIISHKHKFIFIHTPKTGGSSIAVSLLRCLGEEDIYIGAVRDALHENISSPLLSIRAYRSAAAAKTFMTGMVSGRRRYDAALSNAVKAHYRRVNLGPHAGWQTIRNFLGEDVWSRYYKFAFERNPWDKMVSFYHWNARASGTDRYSFAEYLHQYEKGWNIFSQKPLSRLSSWDLYAQGERILVDGIGRYESLPADMASLLQKAGVPWDGWLPQAKGGHRQKKGDYRVHYTPETEALVGRLFFKEIKAFGYKF